MEIIDLNSSKIEQETLVRCAELYCNIWKEPPWNEDFWTVPAVLADMQMEFSKKFANAFLIKAESEVVGFTWGYAISKDEASEICGSNDLDFIFYQDEPVFYIDELGIDPLRRCKGMGKHISSKLIDWARDCGSVEILLRTDEKAIAARKLYEKLGFQELVVKDAVYEKRTYWRLSLSNQQ